MKNFLFIVFFLLNPDIDYKLVFMSDYDEAIEFMESNEDIFETICGKFDNDPTVISSIVFPETIRYSMIRDYLETTSLDLVYVNTGLADFSIGNFQIKPSFAEKIEFHAEQNLSILEPEICKWFSYNTELKGHEIRKERMNRLKSPSSQLYYINFFYSYLQSLFPELQSEDTEYLIRFASTAYNYDFEGSKERIIENMDGKFFPWGVNNEKEKFNYADISWYYFKRISQD